MDRFKSFIKNNTDTFRLMVLLFFIVVLLVVFHVVSLNRMADIEVKRDMEMDTKVAVCVLDNKLSGLGSLAKQGAAAVARVSEEHDSVEFAIDKLLDTYVYAEQFDECYYLTADKKLYMQNGQLLPISDDQIERIWSEDDEPHSYRLLSDLGIGSSVFYMASPSYIGNKKIGYFLGGLTSSYRFSEETSTYMELESNIFLIDKNGHVFAEIDKAQDSSISNLNNLYSYLEGSTVKNSNEPVAGCFSTGGNGYKIISYDGKEYAAAYSETFITPGCSIVSIMERDEFFISFVSQRKKEILIMMIDVLIIFITMLCMFLHTFRKERTLEDALCYDSLTGTLTREYFKKSATELLQSNKIDYCVAVIDIIGFRYINELFGRERGNEIIKLLAELIQESIGSRELVARRHAECFEVLVADSDSLKLSIIDISEKLKAFAINVDVTYPVIVRAGIARTTEKNRDIMDLVDKANAARKAVNPKLDVPIMDYEDVLQADIRQREEIEAAQEAAMEHGEFKVFLQPKMDVQKNQLAGAEALVRWIKVDGTMVYPDEFMAVFEANGFVERLDFYMLDQVCKMQKRLEAEGYELVPISVNQSQMLLKNPNYVEKVMDVLKANDTPRELIELELTETAFFGDTERMVDIMNRLRDERCRIDIDDFGSGYSSLNMIKDIPFDILKIDRMFFSDSNSGTGKIILEKIVEMAQAMGVDCICEGVETPEQEDLLRKIGCRYAQGYLYSKPIPMEEFIEKFMRKK
ncbi:MAG: EAL domain-containing protein [Lachnospiraceae bacterium]|nr:EAL domain-containing protein [Lachnospiraceae bacterium]